MNLEALALARAEEQMDSEAWREPRRFIHLVPEISSRRVTCACGACQKCRNREWMRAYRAGTLVRCRCVNCGRPTRRNATAGWCEPCRTKRPAQFRRYAQANFIDGGGI